MRKILKNLTSLLLILSVILNLTGITSLAAPPDTTADTNAVVNRQENKGIQTAEEVHINPLYADILDESDLFPGKTAYSGEAGTANEAAASDDEVEYLTSIEEAGAQMRSGMKQREESVVIYFEADQYSKELIYAISDQALVHTGIPTEGDYLRWQYGGWKTSTSYYTSNNRTFMTITYTITYYTTLEQENKVDTKLADVLDELNVSGQNTYTKVRAVYDYICAHTVYDYANLEDDTYKLKYTAYGALIDGTAVCQGYAVLFYRMTLELGVDSRLISGEGNGGAHGWNIVKVGSRYYNADTTWDAGETDYSYFLKCDKNFGNHVRDEEYSTDEFYAAYPMGEEDYSPSAAAQPEAPVISSVYSKVQTSVKVTWGAAEGADGYELYRSTDPDATEITDKQEDAEGKWFRAKTIGTADSPIEKYTNSAGEIQYTNGGLTAGQTYYYKVRSYAVNAENEKIYSDFSDMDYMPAAVVFDNVYSNSTSRIRILWNKVDGSHGYQIWRQNEDGTYSVIKTLGDRGNTLTDNQGETTAYSNTGLEAGKTYTYKMRAFYIPEDGRKVYGTYSDEFTAAVMPVAPELTVSSLKAGKAALEWTAADGAAGYQIWMAESEGGSYSLVKSITDGSVVSYTKSDLTSGSTCYFKIRAYTDVNDRKTFGEYSDIKSVKIN